MLRSLPLLAAVSALTACAASTGSGSPPRIDPVDVAGAPCADLDALARAVVAALGDGPLAVRSSAVDEDLADRSFAGQYETVLGVAGPAEVAAAIASVLASAGTSRVDAYAPERDAGVRRRRARRDGVGTVGSRSAGRTRYRFFGLGADGGGGSASLVSDAASASPTAPSHADLIANVRSAARSFLPTSILIVAEPSAAKPMTRSGKVSPNVRSPSRTVSRFSWLTAASLSSSDSSYEVISTFMR